MVWDAIISGGLGLIGSSLSSSSASDAAEDMEDAAAQGLVLTGKQQRLQDYKSLPYEIGGQLANNQLLYLMGLGDPNAVPQIESNFDKEAYRNWLVSEKTKELQLKYKDPNQAAKLNQAIVKEAAKIDKDLEKTGAWKDYMKRVGKGKDLSGDFWQTQDRGGAQGFGEGYGFLQQRFNNQLFEKDPGYQWRMQEGANALQGSAAARGGLLSGAAMKAMERYGQEYGSEEYQKAFNRFNSDQQNIYNRLAGISGTGQQQMNTQGALQSNSLSAMNDARMNAANAAAAGAAARTSGYQNIGNALMSGMAAYNANQLPPPSYNWSGGDPTSSSGIQWDL